MATFEAVMNSPTTKRHGESARISSLLSLHNANNKYHKRRRRNSSSSCGGLLRNNSMARAAAFTVSLISLTEHETFVQSAQSPNATSPKRRAQSLYAAARPLNTTLIYSDPFLTSRSEWVRQSPSIARILDENNAYNNTYDDAYYSLADDSTKDDAFSEQIAWVCEDKTCKINEQCTKFLFGFLEGTTDAKDNCEGIMNAYVAADCGTIKTKNSKDTYITADDDDFNDDYLGIFYDHQCCSSLRSHYYEYCDDMGLLNEYNLLVVAGVMLLCECAKSIVKKNNIRFLPEAAACMLVGMACALGADFFGASIELFSFDEQIFMYLLLPPIIFEAALSVNKREFRRRRGAIMIFAVLGTLLSSFITGTIAFFSAKYFGDEPLDLLDSLVFGSLISSIDPVAILSVLTSLNMSETDTIYILVFGESLLNDGVAITLFKSLLEHYHSSSTSFDDILGSVADFLIIACGSCAIGLTCGVACLCYFHLNSSILHPVMEVASFFLWAVIPYWMAEAFEWSGIVAIVVMGFFMDIYLRPGWDPEEILREERQNLIIAAESAQHNTTNDYHNMDDDSDPRKFRFRGTAVDIPRPSFIRAQSIKDGGKRQSNLDTHLGKLSQEPEPDTSDNCSRAGTSMTATPNVKAILMKKETVRLSREADEHVRFVAHILSQMSENAIFAYLGLFLFSSKYEWDAILCSIGVASCILSRAIMVLFCSWFIWYLHVLRQRAGCEKRKILDSVDDGDSSSPNDSSPEDEKIDPNNTPISKSARALSNAKVQVVLILAGLRGAVSLALVESIPIYNGVTGIGSKNKPLLKAMTSSSIIFTIFVLGGGAFYILKWLDISSDDMLVKRTNNSGNPRDYLYPTLYCGRENTELELASGTKTPPPAPRSWSDLNLNATSPRSRPRYLRDGYVMPSPQRSSSRLLEYSLSADTRASSTAGLNPIHAHELSAESDVITVSRSRDFEDRQRNLV
ncbi:hypothetical protein ACHAWX_005826 [Stephanocyclus meneghinianus]